MTLMLWCLLSCGGPSAPPEPEALRYTVIRGDTLFEIARAHDVTLTELRTWNQIEGDLIEVGQVLEIRSDGSSGAAPARRSRPRGAKPAPQPVGGGTADLSMPREQPCTAGPDADALGEHDLAASTGLSPPQVRAAMSSFVHHTLRCMPEGFAPDSVLTLELRVACSGRVAEVDLPGGTDWPEPIATCVRDVLAFAPFPAHGLPDGEVFTYPLHYTPP